MRKILIGSIVMTAILCLGGVCATLADQAAVEQATQAADAWLKLVDAGDYAASYQQTSSLFKDLVSQAKWTEKAGAARKPLGKLDSRRMKTAQYEATLPGAPDGQYVVVLYDSSFAHKKSAIETVTMMLDKDGKWHVVGYFIR
ncbi:MAG: DUF4019 domain-containing protein [Candidatus Binataceae bacterium]